MGAKVMEIQTIDNVFDALADTNAEAANLKARSELLSALKARVRSRYLSQEVLRIVSVSPAPVSMACCRARWQILARRIGEPSHGLGPSCAYPDRRSGLTAKSAHRRYR
jgi:hypothetical protein